MTPQLLKTRPMVVEAVQVTKDNIADVAAWCGGVPMAGRGVGLYTDTDDFAHAFLGDWVVKGPFGEFYPAADKVIFAKYEAVVSVVSE